MDPYFLTSLQINKYNNVLTHSEEAKQERTAAITQNPRIYWTRTKTKNCWIIFIVEIWRRFWDSDWFARYPPSYGQKKTPQLQYVQTVKNPTETSVTQNLPEGNLSIVQFTEKTRRNRSSYSFLHFIFAPCKSALLTFSRQIALSPSPVGRFVSKPNLSDKHATSESALLGWRAHFYDGLRELAGGLVPPAVGPSALAKVQDVYRLPELSFQEQQRLQDGGEVFQKCWRETLDSFLAQFSICF